MTVPIHVIVQSARGMAECGLKIIRLSITLRSEDDPDGEMAGSKVTPWVEVSAGWPGARCAVFKLPSSTLTESFLDSAYIYIAVQTQKKTWIPVPVPLASDLAFATMLIGRAFQSEHAAELSKGEWIDFSTAGIPLQFLIKIAAPTLGKDNPPDSIADGSTTPPLSSPPTCPTPTAPAPSIHPTPLFRRSATTTSKTTVSSMPASAPPTEGHVTPAGGSLSSQGTPRSATSAPASPKTQQRESVSTALPGGDGATVSADGSSADSATRHRAMLPDRAVPSSMSNLERIGSVAVSKNGAVSRGHGVGEEDMKQVVDRERAEDSLVVDGELEGKTWAKWSPPGRQTWSISRDTGLWSGEETPSAPSVVSIPADRASWWDIVNDGSPVRMPRQQTMPDPSVNVFALNAALNAEDYGYRNVISLNGLREQLKYTFNQVSFPWNAKLRTSKFEKEKRAQRHALLTGLQEIELLLVNISQSLHGLIFDDRGLRSSFVKSKPLVEDTVSLDMLLLFLDSAVDLLEYVTESREITGIKKVMIPFDDLSRELARVSSFAQSLRQEVGGDNVLASQFADRNDLVAAQDLRDDLGVLLESVIMAVHEAFGDMKVVFCRLHLLASEYVTSSGLAGTPFWWTAAGLRSAQSLAAQDPQFRSLLEWAQELAKLLASLAPRILRRVAELCDRTSMVRDRSQSLRELLLQKAI